LMDNNKRRIAQQQHGRLIIVYLPNRGMRAPQDAGTVVSNALAA
jgi:hypothetical protein